MIHGTDIHGPQKINPNNVGDLAPPTDQNVHLPNTVHDRIFLKLIKSASAVLQAEVDKVSFRLMKVQSSLTI